MPAQLHMATLAAARTAAAASAGNGWTWSATWRMPLASKNAPHDGDPDGPIRFYGRRKGKPLKAGRVGLLETLLPQLKIPEPEKGQVVDPAALFAVRPKTVWLEIGFGGGEHLAAQAASHRDV